MFYPHHQSSQPTSSSSKHHDGAPGLGGGPPNGLGPWGRHAFPGGPPGGPGGPGGLPLPSPSFGGGPPGGGPPGGPGSNGLLGYPPPNHHHPSHNHGPHHPSFGSGVQGGLHLSGGGGGQGFGGGYGGMGMFGAGSGANGSGATGTSPPRQESSVPLTPFWQHQLMRAEASRLSSSPHHRARSAAMASRMSNKPSAVTISDPNHRPNSAAGSHHLAAHVVNGNHQKKTSLSVLSSSTDRTHTPPLQDPTITPAADPATPAAIPAPNKDDDEPSEPWTGLDLGGIKLRTLSTALFAFTHITSLYINHNALTTLPPSIAMLRQLTLLDATSNELTSIPPELGVLCKLKDLLLFDNHLSTLPPELGTLYNLETLGIEGNPLEERLRKILAEEGTTALIHHLRDSCPIGPVPPERQWIEIEPDVSSPSAGKQESFTVLSYNILCHHFAPGTTYSYTPSWALDWNYRKQTILQEIINASADVVCLQEIDGEQYADYFYPQLKQHGYEGSHYSRTRARTMSTEEASKVDGCATFWKNDRFSLVETQVVEFNQVALQKTDMRTDDMFNRVMSRDNIAVTASLEFIASGARLLVANSHIYWDHRYRDVKLVQIGMLMEELEKIAERFSTLPPKPTIEPEYNNGRGPPKYERNEKGRDIPLILCVDLNSLAGSAVYDFLSTGEIPPDHEDFMSHVYGPYTAKGLHHKLGLKSACSSFGEMKMTNFTPTFKAAIDYVFHTPRSLKVTSVLGDVDRSYLDKTVGFPNAHFPSDHIPVFAQFRVKGKSEPAPVREVSHGR